MAHLHRGFAPYLNLANPEAWMGSWHRRETRRLDGAPAASTPQGLGREIAASRPADWRRVQSRRRGAPQDTPSP